MNSECIFCKIVNGEVPYDKIYENDYVIAFLNVKPSSPGHVLVIPKKHYNTMLDLPEDLLCDLIKTVQKISKAVLSVVDTDSFNLVVNTGKNAGQLVEHVHFHIIPRLKEDKRILSLSSVPYKDGQKEQVLEKIKKVLK